METSTHAVWIENTTSKFDHGGPGWEFGSCVWSPAKDRRAVEGRYKIMREVQAGDLFINCYDGVITGTSKAKGRCTTVKERPPNPGPWAYASSFHRIELEAYQPAVKKETLNHVALMFREKIRDEIESSHPTYYLFSWWPITEFHPKGRP